MNILKQARTVTTTRNYIEIQLEYPEAKDMVNRFRLFAKEYHDMTESDINLLNNIADGIEDQMMIPF